MAKSPHTQPMLPGGSLEGKTIVITGGGSGLGRAMGEYFLQLGASLVIASRKKEKVEKAASQMMQTHGGEVLPVSCDVRDYHNVELLLNETVERFGKADVLLNNAAGNFISPTERLSDRAFNTIIDIVLRGTANCTLAFGKHWIKREQKATVLNIVTTYATTGSAYVVPSASAKAGVVAMTRSLAVEWAKYGIRLNGIAPGPFPTEGAWDRLLPGELRDKLDLSKQIPLRRMGEHQELANLAAYLVSDFSAFMNGEIVTFDGGEWLQGAGQFNMLEEVPQKMWDQIEEWIRAKKE